MKRKKPAACPYHLGERELRCLYFEIGMGRCATRSIFAAFKRLGIVAMHGTGGCRQCVEDHLAKMKEGSCDCDIYRAYEYVGHMASFHWQQLAEERPDAKFVLPVRPLDDWLSSYGTRAWKRRGNRDRRRIDLMRKKVFGIVRPDKSSLKQGYIKYRKQVEEYFQGTGRLLVVDAWEDDPDDFWKRLAAFTGTDPPPKGTSIPRMTRPISYYKDR